MSPRPPAALQVSPTLSLPADAVTRSSIVLAMRGAGKSNTGVDMAEEMFDLHLPWVAIDPKGDWWGLRLSADGTGPGLPILVFGGLHGDLPLDPRSGAAMAGLIVELNLTCVLDVSEFDDADRILFLTDFGRRLYRLHGDVPQPRHLFLEEADEFIPQTVTRELRGCVNVWSRIVTKGRQRGLGCTMLSQRSAMVNKNVTTQTDMLIALRTTAKPDRERVREWVDYHAVSAELVNSLPSLRDGEAWVCSPEWLGKVVRVRFRRRRTFDSGATPTSPVQTRTVILPGVDLSVVRERLAAMVERVQEEDPQALRRRIAELEGQVAALRRGAPPAARVVETVEVEVPVLDPAVRRMVEAVAGRLQELAAQGGQLVDGARSGAVRLQEALAAAPAARSAGGATVARSAAPGPSRPRPADRRPQTVPRAPATPQPATSQPAAPPSGDGQPGMPRAQAAVLTVLAQSPQGRTKHDLAVLTGYVANTGHFNNTLGQLRTAELIVGTGNQPIRATDAGAAALAGQWEPLPTGPALLEYWVGKFGKAAGLVLRTLVEVWPEALSKEELAARSGYVANTGHFNNTLGRLRTAELITGRRNQPLRADDTLAEAARAGRR
jgi:hypothetical protein